MSDKKADSATKGMTLAERIVHVGGRENAQGYIEFGSPMAVKALIDHVLRDAVPSHDLPDGSRKAFICVYCEGVYADDPVTQCDCLGGEPMFHQATIVWNTRESNPTRA